MGKYCDSHKSKWRKRLRRIFAVTIVVLFICLFIILITWAILQPKKPHFILQDATIFNFNVSAPNLISSQIQVTVWSRNPNDKIGIYYDKLHIYATYHSQQITYYTSIPDGYQGHKDSNVWSPFVYGTDVPIAPYNGPLLTEDKESGSVWLNVKIDGRVKWKVGAVTTGRSCIMIPRGRTKKCGSVAAERALKKPKRGHPALVIEPNVGPAPRYTQQTLHDQSLVPSATSSHRESSLTPIDQSVTPTSSSYMESIRSHSGGSRSTEQRTVRLGGSTPAHQSSHTPTVHDEVREDDENDDDDDDDEDGDAGGDGDAGEEGPGSGIPESSSARVRGEDRPLTPPRDGKLKCKIYLGKLVGPGVARFFRKQIKRKINAFWPYFKDIPEDIKDKLWLSFLDIYDVEGGPLALARQIFEKENQRKWRDFLTKSRKDALDDNEVEDVARLRGTPCPSWVKIPSVWQQYVEHWCKDDQRAISRKARANRLSANGRPGGQCSRHAFGSKGIHVRMYEEEQRTGRTPSILPIILDLNKKKDKVTNEPTGEFYDPNVQKAFDQYKPKIAQRYGADADPLAVQLDRTLWEETEPAKPGAGKGRLLGVGTSAVLDHMTDSRPAQVAPNPLLETLQEENKVLKDEVSEVKKQLANLTAMMSMYMAGASVPSSATGLLAQVQMSTPDIQHPQPLSQPPSQHTPHPSQSQPQPSQPQPSEHPPSEPQPSHSQSSPPQS